MARRRTISSSATGTRARWPTCTGSSTARPRSASRPRPMGRRQGARRLRGLLRDGAQKRPVQHADHLRWVAAAAARALSTHAGFQTFGNGGRLPPPASPASSLPSPSPPPSFTPALPSPGLPTASPWPPPPPSSPPPSASRRRRRRRPRRRCRRRRPRRRLRSLPVEVALQTAVEKWLMDATERRRHGHISLTSRASATSVVLHRGLQRRHPAGTRRASPACRTSSKTPRSTACCRAGIRRASNA